MNKFNSCIVYAQGFCVAYVKASVFVCGFNGKSEGGGFYEGA